MKKRPKKSSYLLGGSAIGAVNGLFGGGGGMIAVPLLERASLLPARSAHATAIAVILPASAVSGIVYACHGLTPPSILLPVAIGVTAGGFFGAKLLARAGVKFLEILFAALMLVAGVRMLLP